MQCVLLSLFGTIWRETVKPIRRWKLNVHLHCLECLFLQVVEAVGNRALVLWEGKHREQWCSLSLSPACAAPWKMRAGHHGPGLHKQNVLFSIHLTWILKSIRTWTLSCSFAYRYLTLRLACLSEGTPARGFCDSIRLFTSVSSYLIHIFKMIVGTQYLELADVSFADKAMQLQLD